MSAVILPTSELFYRLLEVMTEFNTLYLDIDVVAAAALWAVGTFDEALAADRMDGIVGDLLHDAESIEGPECLDALGVALSDFCADLRQLLAQLGLVPNPNPVARLLPSPASPLTFHLLLVDNRHCMHVNVTPMGLPPTLETVTDAYGTHPAYTRTPEVG